MQQLRKTSALIKIFLFNDDDDEEEEEEGIVNLQAFPPARSPGKVERDEDDDDGDVMTATIVLKSR